MKYLKFKLTVLIILASITTYCQYPTTKTIGKDSVVIVTTKQAEIINKVHTAMLDSLALAKNEAFTLSYFKLEAIDRMVDLGNKLDIYRYEIQNKDLQIKNLSAKKRNHVLPMMLLLIGWTLYTGIHTQTIK